MSKLQGREGERGGEEGGGGREGERGGGGERRGGGGGLLRSFPFLVDDHLHTELKTIAFFEFLKVTSSSIHHTEANCSLHYHGGLPLTKDKEHVEKYLH